MANKKKQKICNEGHQPIYDIDDSNPPKGGTGEVQIIEKRENKTTSITDKTENTN